MENLERAQIREEFMRKLSILEKMKACNHVFISDTTINGNGRKRTSTANTEVCVKCGLNKEHSYTGLALGGDATLSVYAAHVNSKGISLDIACPVDLASSIYENIITSNPGISEVQALEYFVEEMKLLNNNTQKEIARRG